jgi:hypothetical protein
VTGFEIIMIFGFVLPKFTPCNYDEQLLCYSNLNERSLPAGTLKSAAAARIRALKPAAHGPSFGNRSDSHYLADFTQ